jgi:hypothetical protein
MKNFEIGTRNNRKINNNHDRVRYNEHQVNELEQYTRRNSIRINGMDDTNKNETPEDTEQKVLTFLKDKLDTDLDPKDIDIAHIIRKFIVDGNRPVIC